jgi:hypothetical protein
MAKNAISVHRALYPNFQPYAILTKKRYLKYRKNLKSESKQVYLEQILLGRQQLESVSNFIKQLII